MWWFCGRVISESSVSRKPFAAKGIASVLVALVSLGCTISVVLSDLK